MIFVSTNEFSFRNEKKMRLLQRRAQTFSRFKAKIKLDGPSEFRYSTVADTSFLGSYNEGRHQKKVLIVKNSSRILTVSHSLI